MNNPIDKVREYLNAELGGIHMTMTAQQTTTTDRRYIWREPHVVMTSLEMYGRDNGQATTASMTAVEAGRLIAALQKAVADCQRQPASPRRPFSQQAWREMNK